MVKVQDGSIIPALQLFTNEIEDDLGQTLEFKEVKDAPVPRWQAEAKMNDGTKRSRTYTVSLLDVNLVVRMAINEEEEDKEDKPPEKPEPKTEKVVHEVHPTASTTASKKSTTTVMSTPSDQLGLSSKNKR